MTSLTYAPPELREQLAWMREQLDFLCLDVWLIPAPEPQGLGHYIRYVANQNPQWYRRLLQAFPRYRRPGRDHNRYPDSRLKRGAVVDILDRLIDGRGSASIYATSVLACAREELEAANARAEGELRLELDAVFGPAVRPRAACM
jgi:hypothetical protein